MLRLLIFLLLLARAASANAGEPVLILNPQSDDQHPAYVQIIVTACPAVEKALEPQGQGDVPGDHKSRSHAERIAWYRSIGCVEVPIPMEWLTREMTYAACTQHGVWQAGPQHNTRGRPNRVRYLLPPIHLGREPIAGMRLKEGVRV